MAEVAVYFTDVERDGEQLVDFSIQPLGEMTPDTQVTPALHTAGLIAYILANGYHEQYNEAFIKEAKLAEQEEE